MSEMSEQASTRRALAAMLRQRLAAAVGPSSQAIVDLAELRTRRREAEESLAEDLASLPNCKVVRSPSGTYVCLLLDGISVFSRTGVVGACRAWLAEANEQEGTAQRPLRGRRR